MTLAGRVAVVAGASGGIGAATAVALGTAGARVARLARSLADARTPGRLDLACDAADDAAVARAARAVDEALGAPDVVVVSTGAFALAPLAETTPDQLDAQVRANLRAPFVLARHFVPRLRERRGGLLVLVGSVADHVALPGNTAYAATKYGLRGLHETLVAELAGTGVRCSLVSPGPTDTSLWDPLDPDGRADLPDRASMLRPDDVADAVVFLATRPPHVHVDWLRLGPA